MVEREGTGQPQFCSWCCGERSCTMFSISLQTRPRYCRIMILFILIYCSSSSSSSSFDGWVLPVHSGCELVRYSVCLVEIFSLLI
jgi:hypothetical protein